MRSRRDRRRTGRMVGRTIFACAAYGLLRTSRNHSRKTRQTFRGNHWRFRGELRPKKGAGEEKLRPHACRARYVQVPGSHSLTREVLAGSSRIAQITSLDFKRITLKRRLFAFLPCRPEAHRAHAVRFSPEGSSVGSLDVSVDSKFATASGTIETCFQRSGIYVFLISFACVYYLLNASLLLAHHDLGWHLAAGDLIREQGQSSLPGSMVVYPRRQAMV